MLKPEKNTKEGVMMATSTRTIGSSGTLTTHLTTNPASALSELQQYPLHATPKQNRVFA